MIVVGDEVRTAIAAQQPVVALESTIFSTLGLPSPANVEALQLCLSAVRKAGATPALTAVLDGAIWAGVPQELHERVLGCSVKVAARDLAIATSQKFSSGATTVSASLVIADQVGIEVFATGGIGGVHRESEITADVSADLNALAQHPVMVVSAGAKAFLDLPRTLEYLETQSVPVVGWQTNEFPAFYTRTSGLPISHRVDDAIGAAQLHLDRRGLGQGGTLLVVPIPAEAELDSFEIDRAIEKSLVEVQERGLTGPQVTPHVLAAVEKATAGESVAANLALAEHNASIAGQVAVEIAAR
ncbi:MAG: pseudouridine-5'-phosphate glycosidase [Actinomycetota bacterium]|nr:pseudouridine-5'-phosphate glycosidase [Actinomycetota bacterium]MEC9473106.1 pseudouridine-5'-phosphate glycosidase [Actinomycetota bacterium]MED5293814.1 pseudouridine-5'-phosphate glycosidase [Actinomycetota bacterium]